MEFKNELEELKYVFNTYVDKAKVKNIYSSEYNSILFNREIYDSNKYNTFIKRWSK